MGIQAAHFFPIFRPFGDGLIPQYGFHFLHPNSWNLFDQILDVLENKYVTIITSHALELHNQLVVHVVWLVELCCMNCQMLRLGGQNPPYTLEK
jgi:hypothetical protein